MDDQPVKEEYSSPQTDPEDPEAIKKRNRKRIVIIISIVFGGLILLALLALLIIYLIGLSLTQICQNMCDNCTCNCTCDETCSDACSESCNNSCQNSCESSSCTCGGDDITASAQTGDSYFDIDLYRKYVWETIIDWFHNLFQ